MFYANSLIEGDCLQILPFLDTNSVNLILCDLPYGVTGLDWDTRIPMEKLWPELLRILTPKGTVVFLAQQPFTDYLLQSYSDIFKAFWIWERPIDGNFALSEDILIFEHTRTIIHPPKRPKVIEIANGYLKEWKGKFEGFIKIRGVGRRAIHPTQKPVALFEHLMTLYSYPGDLVLDCCAGSGTTGEACFRSSRRYILIEKEQKYCRIIRERIGFLRQMKQFPGGIL
jgi:site-specific DNA-methyltransferase (adenine-specific)